MQASFLSLCAEYMLNKSGDDLSSSCIVFPTRRAALFFRKELAGHITKPVFAPEILSVNDFADALSSVKTTDTVNLLFHLFKSYRKEFPEETFNHYFHWGEMMLRDFNEMDMECTDAGKLFAAIHDWKDMESRFEWEADELAAVKKFWSEFSLRDPGLLQKSFLDSWKSIPAIYRHFHQSAFENRFASEGMTWANALSSVKSENYLLKWSNIFFCGFYFINRIHQQLANALNQKANVEFLYDADAYYVDDPHQEAGFAFRKMKTPVSFKGNYFSTQPKTITVTGVPMGTMQVKTAGHIIREWMKDGSHKSTAIVLPDEKLLLPLLNSMPEEVRSFNVTMGFPAQHTVTGSFIRLLYDVHSNSISSSGKFSGLLLLPLLSHPGLPVEFRKSAASVHNEILKSQLLWMNTGQISNCHLDELLVYSERNAGGVMDYILGLLVIMAKSDNVFESAVASFIHEKLSEIKPAITGLADVMDETAAWKVIMKIIRSLRIPFSGEPVAGIQIMGMLETRALDFDRILVLSVNEGLMPPDKSVPSFIPYSLRKAFGMPVTEDHDAVYAYHFYRLLQRADEVHLIYDTEGKQFSGGEMSRFSIQLMNEAERKSNGNCKVSHRVLTAPMTILTDEKIEISKSQEMMNVFRKKIAESENGFSASALTTYISCKLRFYFRYIAGLKEPDELREVPGPEVLGNLLHHAMEFLYVNKKQVTANDIQAMRMNIEQAVESAFQKNFMQSSPAMTGYHLLNRQIVNELIHSILKTDSMRAPFRLEGLEKKLKAEITDGIFAGGVIDRIQKKEGVIEILDYKTGKAELTADFEKVFTNPKYKAAFQLYYYVMLARREFNNVPLKAGLYVMKQLSGGITFLNEGEIITDEAMEEFEERLSKLIAEILDSNVSFEQTEDLGQCMYCPYSSICKR